MTLATGIFTKKGNSCSMCLDTLSVRAVASSGQASESMVLVHTLGMCLWHGLQSELHILPAACIQLQISILGM